MTIETDEVLVIRPLGKTASLWCQDCFAKVSMITAEEAAGLAGVSPRTIHRWVDAAKIHCIETSQGLLICLNSLWKEAVALDQSETQKLKLGGEE